MVSPREINSIKCYLKWTSKKYKREKFTYKDHLGGITNERNYSQPREDCY